MILSRFSVQRGFSEVVFSLNCYVAGMLALFIALYCDLEKPYWALMTAYITSQPFNGAIRSKAVYRLMGTLVGAVMMVFLVPPLSSEPVIMSLAISVWVGICLFFSLLDRTPRSYFFLLAGFTTAVIGFPIVGAPATSFEVALARFEEIAVGVSCSAIIHSIFFPRSLRQALTLQTSEVMAELHVWLADTLMRKKDAVHKRGRIRLAAGITDLYLASTNIPFDTHEPQRVHDAIIAIQKKTIRLFPLITGLSDRLKRLEGSGGIPETLAIAIEDTLDWINASEKDFQRRQNLLRKEYISLKNVQNPPSWRDLLLLNVITRMIDIIDVYASCRKMVLLFPNGAPARPYAMMAVRNKRVLNRDFRAAAVAGISVMAIIFCGCMLWIGTGWPSGAIAVMMSCVVYCIFISLANPVPAQKNFMYLALIASVIAGIYLFVILPQTHSFVTLALAFSVMLIPSGILLAQPGVGIRYTPLIVTFCASLTLTEHFSPNMETFLNNSVAQFIGISCVVALTGILHRYDSARLIQRSMRATWNDVSKLASGTRRFSSIAWTSLMVDRLGILAPHADVIKKVEEYKSVNAMQEMRTGLNIIRLYYAAGKLSAEQYNDIRDMLGMVSDHFSGLVKSDRFNSPPDTLLRKIDCLIASLSGLPSGSIREAILNALTGLRCNLFPDAWAYMYGVDWHD